ncbi:hypothetical protein CKM354_001289600 [Cercospora kikuchii]|uniref:Uncharacterized protein n=1 Tax=Cercospora kikuchii TaxID=84275 RepID=A0A9P3FMU5_9PEZI|nr:uncharacterized protein CKM354_001289600 [Cercospora kikuchii]GIZ49878.1 hypothetical protein CKM354_001289600 [Cercospora kikuchii]
MSFAAQTTSAASAATVRIFLVDSFDNQPKFLTEMPREKLQLHSRGFDCFLSSVSVANEQTRDITLPYGSSAALKFVLEAIRNKKSGPVEQFYLNVTKFTKAQNVRIWEACQILSIEPTTVQERLAGKLAWDLSHDPKTTATDLQEAWHVFSRYDGIPPTFKVDPLASVIHQFCWDKVHDQYNEAEADAIMERCRATSVALDQRVRAKLAELLEKKQIRDAHRVKSRLDKEERKRKSEERARREQGGWR